MISIIVPIYRVEPYLKQCIDSILNQTYRNFELILIDDGSPDHCGIICDEYAKLDSRISVYHTENKGLAAARNLGIRKSTGDFIGFIDSDDWIEPDMYEKLLLAITDYDADISNCGLWYEKDSGTEESNSVQAVYKKEQSIEALLNGKINNYAWNKLFRSYIFDSLLYPEGREYEDIAIMHAFVERANKVACISKHEYHYRQRPDSISKTRSAKTLIDYADAWFLRCIFIKKTQPTVFKNNEELLLKLRMDGMSRVWRWWYRCSKEEKKNYGGKIRKMKEFTKKNIPLFGLPSWPAYLRITTFFMHSDCAVSFAVLYYLNSCYRKIKGEK